MFPKRNSKRKKTSNQDHNLKKNQNQSFLQKKYGHVSWERLVSGMGIYTIYQFLKDVMGREEPSWLNQKLNEGIFSVKNFEGAFGLEYDISESWAASGQVFYLHDFELNAGEYFQLRNMGLNFSLKYKL